MGARWGSNGRVGGVGSYGFGALTNAAAVANGAPPTFEFLFSTECVKLNDHERGKLNVWLLGAPGELKPRVELTRCFIYIYIYTYIHIDR